MAYVYRFKDYKTGEVIYIGETKRAISKRMSEHFGDKGHLPNKCYKSVGRIEYMKMNTEADALLVENYLINKYKPKYNTKDKVESKLTYSLKIKENWLLYEVMNKRESLFTLPKLIEITFWGAMIFFFILAIFAKL